MLKKVVKISVSLLLIISLSVGIFAYFQYKKRFPSTDDAYVQANIVNISAQINGEIDAVHVRNQQYVKKGELLFSIDATPFETELKKAEANLSYTKQQIKSLEASVDAAKALVAEREAELANAQLQSRRILALVKKHAVAAAQGDAATRDLSVAQASLSAAKQQLLVAQQKLGEIGDENAEIRAAQAAVVEAQIKLKYTKVYAPVSGHLNNFSIRKGAEVAAFQPLFSIVDNNEWWILANFKETNLENIRPNQTAKVKLDMYPNKVFTGRVVSISAGSGASFALLPPENASGNWVKVTQRFPIRISLPATSEQYPFRVGASCSVTIDTRTGP